MRLALRRLVNAGVVVVAGAGNSGWDLAGPDQIYGNGDDAIPAALSEAMAVSAMDATTDTLWAFSNFSQIERTNIPSGSSVANYVVSPGGAIDVAAPGVNIVTTAARQGGEPAGTHYAIATGTSAAAPHVTGLVALYIAANGRATNAAGVYAIRQAIINASQPQSQWNTNNTHDPDTNPEPLAIASENWVPFPAITHTAGAPGNFQVNFVTVPGYDYTVQSATALTPPIDWTNLVTVSGNSNVAPASVTDTNAGSRSFYRLSRTPSP
jgi:subtilisin family serine protease